MDLLPPETVTIILGFLGDKNKRIFRAINSRWFKFVKYSNFKLFTTKESDLPQITERFSKYSWPISLEFKKPNKISCDVLQNYLTQITTLTGLKMYNFVDTLSKEDSGSLTALTNLNSIDIKLRMNLLGNFTNLTSIKLDENTFYAKLLENLKIYTKLESVSLSFNFDKQDDIFQYFSNPSILTALELHTYGLQNTKNTSRFVNLQSLMHTTGQKMSLKFPMLRKLYSNKPKLLEGLEKCSNLTCLDLFDRADLASNATSLIFLTKLKKLRITNHFDKNIDQTLEILTVTPDLDEFIFHPKYGDFYPNIFSNIISKKLTRLECSLNSDKQSGGSSTMSCIRQIGQISTLKRLFLTIEYTPDSEFANIADYDPLMGLTNLTNLKMKARREDVVHDMKNISKLTKLRNFNIYVPKDLEVDLSPLTNLEKLTLSNIDQKGFNSISNLTLLTRIQISVNSEQIDFNVLNRILLLRSLSISPITGLSTWQNLTLLTDLRELWISKFDTNDSIYQLTALNNLTFLSCSKSQCSPTSMTVLTSLQKLFLVSAQNSDDAKNLILRSLTNLRDWRFQGEGGFLMYLSPKD